MTDLTEGDVQKKLAQIKTLLNTLPNEFRHKHKLKLSKVNSILSELTSAIDIPVVPSSITPAVPSTFIAKQDSPLKLKNEAPTAQLDVNVLLKTLQGDLIKDLKTSRQELMKGDRIDKEKPPTTRE